MVKFTDNKIVIELEKSSSAKLALDLKTSVAEVINQIDFEPLEDWTPLDLKLRFCLHLSYIFVDEKIAIKKEEEQKKSAIARELRNSFNLAENSVVKSLASQSVTQRNKKQIFPETLFYSRL